MLTLAMDAVVVTHNSEQDLVDLFDNRSLRRAFARIIVVDNASVDRSCEVATAAGATLIERGVNDGFGAAANVGARAAAGERFALLNPDIRFDADDIPRRLQAHFDDPVVGMVGPRLILPNGTTQDSARAVPTPLGLVRRRLTPDQHDAIMCERPCNVPWVVGACVVVRRAAFVAIGGFDARYFLYFEDVDLCVRMRRAGWIVRFDPTVSVEHHHRAASRAPLSSWATRQHMRSALRFLASNPRYVVPRRPARPRHRPRLST